MIDTMGVILTSNNDADLGELTRLRSVAAIPFAGRYRLVDFALSNMVNSGIVNVGIATEYNYQSLLDHLGSGKPWGLARKKYGLRFLPPFSSSSTEADDRIRMLLDVLHYLKRSPQKYVVVADCNIVCNITFDKIVAQHVASQADLTVVYQKSRAGGVYVNVREDGVVTSVSDKGENRLAGYYVFTKDLLVNVLERYQVLKRKEFFDDLIAGYIKRHKVIGYRFDGYLAAITDTNSYFGASMDLMSSDVRKDLFFSDNPILTKVKDMVPTRYLDNAAVSNSMIADGCVIDGTVENCILFRGVTVERGASLKDCIVMQNSVISQNVRLSACIIDKDCVILKGKELVGQRSFPIVVGKRRTI